MSMLLLGLSPKLIDDQRLVNANECLNLQPPNLTDWGFFSLMLPITFEKAGHQKMANDQLP